jgi:hypothetical protein
MKFVVFIFLLINSFISISQNYFDYYKGINKAKLCLVSDSLQASETSYYNTFEKFEFVFARDCYNALEVSSKRKNFEKVDYFLRRCIKQGVEFETLKSDTILSEYKKTEYWPKILLAKDSLRILYERNVNWEIRSEIIEMFSQDQQIRDLADKNRFNIFKIGKLNKEFEKTDSILVDRLIQITETYGFPGEKLIGIDNSSMHPKINSNKLTAGMPIVIFIHHFSQPNPSYSTILIDEVATGYLSNEHYSSISDFEYTYGKQQFGSPLCYSQRFNPDLTVTEINKNRKELNLISISNMDSLQKTKWITPFWVSIY